MQIAAPLFDRFTALDAIGPYEVLSRLPGAEVVFVADQPRLVPTETGMLSVPATRGFDEVRNPDVVVVPGGSGQSGHMHDEQLLGWLRSSSASADWTTSVCTGSLLLGAAGLLVGRRATSHWLTRDRLAEFGALPVDQRVVFDGHVVTAAGVSAGIDLALALAALIAGDTIAQAIQLGLEYDPQPPFSAGSPARAPDAIVDMLRGQQDRLTH